MKLCVNRFISVSVAVLICSALVVSCSKEETPGKEESKAIMFALPDFIRGYESKGIIDHSTISSSKIYVYAEKNTAPLEGLGPALISEEDRGFWYPDPKVLWEGGKHYSFQGYGYLSSNTNCFKNVAANGLAFTVAQPTSYNVGNMGDYIISNRVEVSAEESYKSPLIELTFTHVLPVIELCVTKATAMKTVNVTSMKIVKLYSGATLTYDSVSGNWIPSYTTTRNGSYNGVFNNVQEFRETTPAVMRILTVPQGFTEEVVLTVQYKVDESLTPEKTDMKSHTDTFVLKDYVSEIKTGQRAVFHLHVDTGIHLTASIAPWEKVDFIEGVILPPLD